MVCRSSSDFARRLLDELLSARKMTHPQSGVVFFLLDEGADLIGDIEDAKACLQSIDGLVDILTDPTVV